MYLTIPAILFIIVFVYALAKELQKQKNREEQDKLKEEHAKKMRAQRRAQEEEERNILLQLIEVTFNCPSEKAEAVYKMLESTFHLQSFRDAKSTEERKEICMNSLTLIEWEKELEQQEKAFVEYANLHLMPIVRSEGYDLSAKDIAIHWMSFHKKQDLSIKEKLYQLNFEKHGFMNNRATSYNVICLYQAISPSYSNPEKEFPSGTDTHDNRPFGETDRFLCDHDVATIVNCYNSYFDMCLSSSEIEFVIKDCSYLIIDNIKDKYDLISIFKECVYAQFLELTAPFEVKESFFEFLEEMFFDVPYYDLKNYKNIIISHLDEFEYEEFVTNQN